MIFHIIFTREKTKGVLRKVTKVFRLKWRFQKENATEIICRSISVPGSACIYTGNRAEDSLTCDFI